MRKPILLVAMMVALSACGGAPEPVVLRPKIGKPKPGGNAKLRTERLIRLLKTSRAQQRKVMKRDPRLMRVAKARALDMARRRYFGHVDPDGKGPNWHVARSGYRLPAGWAASPKTNFVESVLGGPGTAAEALRVWTGSRSHRKHLYGDSDFYRTQTRFGVGQVTLPGSPMLNYWVFISAPPEE